MASAARILWTKQLTKKKKTYNDGFVLVKPTREAILYDEDGKELGFCSRFPSSIDITSDDNIKCFEGYLVQGDCACDYHEIKGVHDQQPGSADALSQQPAARSSAVYCRPLQQAPQTSWAPCLARRKRSISTVAQETSDTAVVAAPGKAVEPESGLVCPASSSEQLNPTNTRPARSLCRSGEQQTTFFLTKKSFHLLGSTINSQNTKTPGARSPQTAICSPDVAVQSPVVTAFCRILNCTEPKMLRNSHIIPYLQAGVAYPCT